MEDSTEMKAVGEYMDMQQEVHSAVRKILAAVPYTNEKEITKTLTAVFDAIEDTHYPARSIEALSEAGYHDIETSYKDLRHE